MEDTFAFDMLEGLELERKRAPTQWVARYEPPIQKKPDPSYTKPGSKPKHKQRVYQRKKRVDLFNDDDNNELNLPPFLRRYGVQIKNPWEFSGPSVLKEESDEGCVEYKLRLCRGNPTRFQQLVTQLKFRIAEGGGQCFYCLGVEDNGHPAGLNSSALAESIATLDAMASEVDATATVVRTPPGSKGRHCAFICVRRGPAGSASDLAEVRIAVAGAVDGGKSTLISVLTHGADGQPTLDNGRGAARMAVLRHKHEIESGRTSSLSHRILAYSPSGAVLNYSRVAQFTPRELAASARKFVRFSDLGGHQRYSKTSLHGLTSTRPDYTMLCICASQGISWITLDHLAVSLALGVPVFVVITKVDAVDKSKLENLIEEIMAVAEKATCGGVKNGVVVVENVDQAIEIAHTISNTTSGGGNTQAVVPIFCVSCVTGARVSELHAFFNALPASSFSSSPPSSPTNLPTPNENSFEHTSDDRIPDMKNTTTTCIDRHSTTKLSTHFQVDGTMDIAGVGPVFSGVVVSGSISIGDELLVGPDDEGKFRTVVVSGLHRAQVEVESVRSNQHATVAVEIPAATLHNPRNINDHNRCGLYSGDIATCDIRRELSSSSGGEDEVEVIVEYGENEEGNEVETAENNFWPREEYKRKTSEADIELLGKSWDFVKHLTIRPDLAHAGGDNATPQSPGLKNEISSRKYSTAAAAARAMTAPSGRSSGGGALATSTSSSSTDLSPSDDVDHASVVQPLRPRKGTVLLGCSFSGSTPRNDNIATVGTAQAAEAVDIVGCRYFQANVAILGDSEWTAQHQVMVHCGGVRQAADVLDIEYVDIAHECGDDSDSIEVEKEWVRTVSGVKAAAAVLQHTIPTTTTTSTLPVTDVKTARVEFKFAHRFEFMLPGSRVIFRDKSSGKVVGAGVILALTASER